MWSYGCEGGNLCDASSENTLEYARYWEGMLGFSDMCLGSVTVLQMYILLACEVLGLWICCDRNCIRAASGVQSMTGSWLWLIHPLFQSIRG
jgi:hypothetical protein